MRTLHQEHKERGRETEIGKQQGLTAEEGKIKSPFLK